MSELKKAFLSTAGLFMKNRVSFLRLISELENDIEILSELMKKFKKINAKIKSIKPDEFDWTSLGFVIHNVYTLLENYFLRVSKYFENDLDSASRHKDLVNRMSLEIEDVRPRLFDRNLAEKINELRAFRHIFRFIYQSDLDIEKLKTLNIKLPEIIKRFNNCHGHFIQQLRKILGSL